MIKAIKKQYVICLSIAIVIIPITSWENNLSISNESNMPCAICLLSVDDQNMECKEIKPKERVFFESSAFKEATGLKFAFSEKSYNNNRLQIEDANLLSSNRKPITFIDLKNEYSKLHGSDIQIDDVLDRSIILMNNE
jgi:hypothetical protein